MRDDQRIKVWVVWFSDHIHTDAYGQLAVFNTREAALAWKAKYGILGCSVRKTSIVA